jgi:hypothetical protein
MTYVDDLKLTALAACDGCGVVGAMVLRHGWRVYRDLGPINLPFSSMGPLSFYPMEPIFRHHCPACAERNELVRAGLVHGVSRELAVIYEEANCG